MRGGLRGVARPGRLLRDLGVDPEQLRRDLLPSLAESGQELRVRRPVTPSAPHPILLADELQGQAVQGDQLRELLDIIGQRGGPDGAGVPPAIFQVDADELDEQAVPLGAGRWRKVAQVVRDLARAAKSPGLLEAVDSRFEFLVSHRRAVRPGGSRIRASDRRTERSERPVSSAISEICRPCSRSSSTRLPKGSSCESTRSSSSARASASSGVGSCWRPRSLPSSTRSRGTSTSTDRRSAPWCLACRSSLCLVMAARSRQRSPPRFSE